MVADRPNVLSVQEYTSSGPPIVTSPTDSGGQLVSVDGDTLAATKQEEWVTKRKTELITTKQIETRVKRQVVLEDGKVVDDSGPIVTTSTTEDTDKKESQHTEHLTQPDNNIPEGWVQIEQLPEEAVVKETNERKVTTHDEVEDVLETEQIQHLGDMSNQALVKAIRQGSDARRAILSGRENGELVPLSQELDSLPKRVINQSKRHDRTTDIEDTKEVSRVKEDGNLVTEITRRHEHEEFHNEDIPDSDSDEFEHIENREGGLDYSHGKHEDLIEYINSPRGGPGVKVGEGPLIVSENIQSSRHGDEDLWESVSERIRKLPKSETLFNNNNNPTSNNNNNNSNSNNKLNGNNNTTNNTANNNINSSPLSRSDALTNRPLNIDQEEYTRKNETNRWLNSHFGSSSSSLNSEASPRSPLHTTPPQGIHVTMISRSSPIHHPHSNTTNTNNISQNHNGNNNHNGTNNNHSTSTASPPPPPPPPLPLNGIIGPKQTYRDTKNNNSKNVNGTVNGISNGNGNHINGNHTNNNSSKSGKRITFSDSPPRSSPLPTKDEIDLRNRHGDVISSLNSQFGTKSGRLGSWDGRPTPPPRSRKRNSRSNTPDHTANTNQGNMSNHPRKYNFDLIPAELLDKNNDLGERKNYERREQSLGYNGPSGVPTDSSYLTKHSDYYNTNETNNPAQTILYENGDAEVTQRKTVERRTKNFTYEGPPQKQLHPKYIVGMPSTTIHRLRGIEQTGVIEDQTDSAVSHRSQTLPRRRFYFGDDEGSLINKSIDRRSGTPDGMRGRGKELRFGVDDIDVSISNSNSYNATQKNHTSDIRRGSSSLNRSLSFTPNSRPLGRDRFPAASFNSPSPSPHFTNENKFSERYKSNPGLLDSPDLLSPRLITNMSRSVRDVNSLSNNSYNNTNSYRNYTSERNDDHFGSSTLTNKQETNNISRSKRTFLDNVRKNTDLYDSLGSKGSSPSRSMTPTYGSPTRSFGNENRVSARPLNSPRALGGANSPMSDDFNETYRMSSSTPDNDYNKPRISTDTTSRFARKTLRGVGGEPAGILNTSETTTRTKSRYKESEVMYPNGRRGSPANFETTREGSVIIPVRP